MRGITVLEGNVINNSILNTLKGSLVGDIPVKFSIFLEQFMQGNRQNGQMRDERTEVHYHAKELLKLCDIVYFIGAVFLDVGGAAVGLGG